MTDIVCLMGMDGSGKSTVIAGLDEWLRSKGVKTQLRHTHDYSVKTLHKVNAVGNERIIRKFPFLFYLWPVVAFFDHFVTYRRSFSGRSCLILTDRYFYDKYVRFRFWRIAFPGLFYLYKWFIPRPMLTVLLDVPTAVAVERKGEYSSEDYDIFRREYLRFANRMKSVLVVDATKPVPEVLDSIKQRLSLAN